MLEITPELLLQAYRIGVFPMGERRDDPKLYWLDPQGARALYSTIPPGGKVSQESHIGASWVITSRDGHCIGVFNAAPVSIAIF